MEYISASNEFEVFKSNVKHYIKYEGQTGFICSVLENDEIGNLVQNGEILNALYLLATIDYLSRLNLVPLYSGYNKIRRLKMEKTVVPQSIYFESVFMGYPIEIMINKCIPEFSKHNIIEGDLFDVV